MLNLKNLLEELAELEHEQWRSWTKYLVDECEKDEYGVVGFWEFEKAKWKKNWKPYKDLTEKEKAKDRVWARKVLNLIERYL